MRSLTGRKATTGYVNAITEPTKDAVSLIGQLSQARVFVAATRRYKPWISSWNMVS